MADNFDLRQFLTENKLTKNTKLLKENSESFLNAIFDSANDSLRSGDIDDDIFNTVKDYIDSHEEKLLSYQDQDPQQVADDLITKATSGELSSIDEGRFSDSYDSPAAKQVGIQLQSAIGNVNTRAEIGPTIEQLIAAAEKKTGTTVTPHEKRVLSSQGYHIYNSSMEMEREGVEEAAPSAGMTAKQKSAVVKKAKHGEDIGHKGAGFAKVEKAAEKQYGSKEAGQKVAAAAMWKAQAAKHEQVNENTMTERDKYLTRLVENALGLQVTEDETVDYTMGRQDDPNQLPNPAPELNIPEGEEMVQEKPLPKYENIEKLMQEIDKSTDEAAHKYKMEEMKRVADALESKCTALEEGDDADHIDQKKLKQMKKDVMSLRKNIEKMEKVNEKKFAKKEPKADLKEGFDLRNFLVENKLTTNSRIVEEPAK